MTPTALSSESTATATAAAPVPTAVPPTLDRIAISSADGAIYTADRDGSNRVRITPDTPAVPGLFEPFYAWPLWSPDGQELLLTLFTPDIAGGLESSLLRVSAGAPGQLPDLLYTDVAGTNGIGGIAHFPAWHPDSGSVALIANVGDGLSTFLIDVDDGLGPAVSIGAPVYLKWSSDGTHLLVHTAERLVLHKFAADGSRTDVTPIGTGSIAYRVPEFAADSGKYLYVDTVDGARTVLLGSVDMPDDPAFVVEADASNAFAWSPEGERFALGFGSQTGLYDSLIVTTDGGAPSLSLLDMSILAFWWSPDGEKILLAEQTSEPGEVALTVVDWQSGRIERIAAIEPSPEMSFLVGFFDQYATSAQLWSPDSTQFLFSGVLTAGSGTDALIQDGDDQSEIWVFDAAGIRAPISLGKGGFGTWSPN